MVSIGGHDTVPIGTLTTVSYETGPSLISLYNLRFSAQVLGAPQLDFSSGQALARLSGGVVRRPAGRHAVSPDHLIEGTRPGRC